MRNLYHRFCITLVFSALLLLLGACQPRIYEFTVSPRTISLNQAVKLNWKVKGTATLQIRDVPYTGSAPGVLADITLLVTKQGVTKDFTLHHDSTLKIPVAGTDSLTVQKQADKITDDRLRYFTLVVSAKGKETKRDVEVAVRPDAAKDEIAFRPVIRGDSLVAADINDTLRWNNRVTILTVADAAGRVLDITHSGVTVRINPGDQPDDHFKGTLVRGYWSFRSLMTPAEKNNHALIPRFLKVSITIKPN